MPPAVGGPPPLAAATAGKAPRQTKCFNSKKYDVTMKVADGYTLPKIQTHIVPQRKLKIYTHPSKNIYTYILESKIV